MQKVYDYITKDTPKRPWPLMVYLNSYWTCRNQLSTYELISNVLRMLTEYPQRSTNYTENKPFYMLCDHINNIVLDNPNTYGFYAYNDNWTPKMTNIQLEAFCLLVHFSWEKFGKYRYNKNEIKDYV